jgi:hypothetical protein
MMFGRVEAVAFKLDSGNREPRLRITVYLETGRQMTVVRDEEVPALRSVAGVADLSWQADQYAQETIANELALEGWEVIGGGEIPEAEPGAMARSASYAVRRLGTVEPT